MLDLFVDLEKIIETLFLNIEHRIELELAEKYGYNTDNIIIQYDKITYNFKKRELIIEYNIQVNAGIDEDTGAPSYYVHSAAAKISTDKVEINVD